MVALQPYPRGFVLSQPDAHLQLPAGWTTVALPSPSWQFSHDEYYRPDLSVNTDETRWVLVHGLCLYAGPDALTGTVADHLLAQWNRSDDDFLQTLDELGGRHLILRGSAEHIEVYHDALGLRSVYSSREAQIVGSHAHLINALHPHRARNDNEGARALTHSWDRTRFVGIEPLLPNHRLCVPSWEIERYFPRTRNRFADWDLDAKLDAFQQLWSTQMTRLIALRTKLVMSITGGADSRTSLALCSDQLKDIQFFTYTAKRVPGSTWSESLALDRDLVEQIKELVPLNHRYFESEKRDPELINTLEPLLKVNTTQQHSRWLVAFYADAFPDEGHTHIRGNGYEVGRAYWGVRKDNDTLASLRNLYMQITKGDHGHVTPEDRRAYFDAGVRKWGYDRERHGYHVRDLAYWEIRSGRWLSEILNETDIAFETFIPINVRALLDITLSMSLPERQNSVIFSELINRSLPVLNFPGKNDIRNLYEQTRDERLHRLGMHTESDSAKLTDTLTIRTPDGTSHEVAATRNELALPAAHFVPAAIASRTFRAHNARLPQTLTFVVDSPYCHDLASNKFAYEVHLDGATVASWDGAAFSRPVHVTVDDLSQGFTVSVAVRSLSHQKDRTSWEAASRALIRDVNYTNGSGRKHGPGPTVWSDAPSHERIDG